jgi:predicted enzyme involved in methoxymalonyl-ACP biosynthesis
MSCRALGRGVEQSFLCTLFDFARQKDLNMIIAPYRSGSRNQQVKTFLLKLGFLPKQSDILAAEVGNATQKPGHIEMRVRVSDSLNNIQIN